MPSRPEEVLQHQIVAPGGFLPEEDSGLSEPTEASQAGAPGVASSSGAIQVEPLLPHAQGHNSESQDHQMPCWLWAVLGQKI